VNTRSHSRSLYLSHTHGKLLVHGRERQAPGPRRASSKLLVLTTEERALGRTIDGVGPRPRRPAPLARPRQPSPPAWPRWSSARSRGSFTWRRRMHGGQGMETAMTFYRLLVSAGGIDSTTTTTASSAPRRWGSSTTATTTTLSPLQRA
jgi:hypothetical protein